MPRFGFPQIPNVAFIAAATLPGAADEIVSPSGDGSGVTERYRTWVNAAPGASKSSDRGDGMSQRLFVEFVVSIGYGVLSSLVPIFNSEIYIVASQVGGFAAEATTAIGCAVGQSIGKVGIVLALRRGVNLRVLRRIRDRPRKPAGRFRTRLRDWSDRAMGLLGDPRWGVLIVFLSASVYLPPLYPVTLAVAEARMSVVLFGVAVLVGRMLLFLAIAFGVSALVH